LLEKSIVSAASESEKNSQCTSGDAEHDAGSRLEKGDRVSPEYPGLGQSSISSFMNKRENAQEA
jgi:hypothetical protein